MQDHGLDMHYSGHYSEPVEDIPQYPTTNMVGLEIGDSEKVFEYYENALKHFQQLNCRQIAKAFIKFIEPRKQVKHPYNGGKPRAGAANGEKGDPEKTKPEWWPAGVVHKEPDHLRKERESNPPSLMEAKILTRLERIRLLIHIIRRLGRFNITPDKLQEVAYDSKRQLRPMNKIEVLDEVFKVRRMEERYERGEIGMHHQALSATLTNNTIDATTLVYVVNRDTTTKGDKDSDSISEPEHKAEVEELDDPEEGFMTPSSSAQPAATSFTSVDMPLAGHTRSMHMSSDREQLFPLPESLSFEEPRAERSYYPSTSEYSDEFSHGMMKPPVTSAMVNPSEASGSFDYLTQAPFPPASAGDQMVSQRPSAMPMQHSVSHFDSWTPSFRPSVFNPMDYGNSANQTLSQPPLSYQMPMTPTSHGSDMPHGLPDPLSHKGAPFPTGSMVTPHHATTA